MRPRISIRGFVPRRSVGQSVRPSVTTFFQRANLDERSMVIIPILPQSLPPPLAPPLLPPLPLPPPLPPLPSEALQEWREGVGEWKGVGGGGGGEGRGAEGSRGGGGG